MRVRLLTVALVTLAAAPALAQGAAAGKPQALTRVLDCRTRAAPEERLACFDREVAALEAAEASRELVVVDQQQLRRTRRSLFGLSLPDLNIFGDGNDDEEAVTALESTIRSASQSAYGKWTLTLADGARWMQIDSRNLRKEPRAGDPIRIRRGAVGSYLANIDGQIAIRVRRER